MLPELLFSVGSSMQDISRDDFGLLTGVSCDKDAHLQFQHLNNNNTGTSNNNHSNHSNHSPQPSGEDQQQQQQQILLQLSQQQQQYLQQHTQQSQQQQQHPLITGTDCTLEPVPQPGRRTPNEPGGCGSSGNSGSRAAVAIKLEEPEQLYPWHSSGHSVADISSNLLCHSDDPLISGAIDDNQNEFHPIHHQHQQLHHHHHHLDHQPQQPHQLHLHHHQLHHHHHHLHLQHLATSPSVSCSLIKAEEPLTPSSQHSGHLLQHHHHQSHPHLAADISLDARPSATTPQSPRTPPPAAPAPPPPAAPPSSAPAQRKPKAPRTRRKGQLKLRFHHQALPQEYLDHYEAAQNSQQKRDSAKAAELAAKSQHQQQQQQIRLGAPSSSAASSSSRPTAAQLPSNPQAVASTTIATRAATVLLDPLPDDDKAASSRAHDSVRSWLQKISEFQHETAPIKTEPVGPTETVSRKASSAAAATPPSAPRIVQYSDLPFMGEMTLDNSKPRRGRKPKKADICHLIYKNYGTILPGTPKNLLGNRPEAKGRAEVEVPPMPVLQSDGVASASLLAERLLTGEPSAVAQPLVTLTPTSTILATPKRDEQPLNLCLRDTTTEPYTILSSDEEQELQDNADDEDRETTASRPTTAATASDTDSLLAANMRMSLPNFQTALDETAAATPPPAPAPGFAYWPTGQGTPFLHPMALYYQQLVDAAQQQQQPSTSGAAPSHLDEPHAKILIPKNISELLRQHQLDGERRPKLNPEPSALSPSSQSSRSATASSQSPIPSSSSPATPSIPVLPAKRKRSAIFIPPMPVASTDPTASAGSHHHATEVSICKFKFTGGPKPTLQEKKMLSVDAGGNFRYYSGTGDKSMRGYEFFPRESLAQSAQAAQAAGGSSAGAFLSAAGERIAMPMPVDDALMAPPSLGLSNEVLQLPADLPSPQHPQPLHFGQQATAGSVANGGFYPPTVDQLPAKTQCSSGTSVPARKSRRSLQREKLEKTFKEKGFLIQTQQLESAEGATYCKFRQLRKFTRYLFRSWKDYLPGELQQQAAGAGAGGEIAGGVMDVEEDEEEQSRRMMMMAAASDATSLGLQEAQLAEHLRTVATAANGGDGEPVAEQASLV